MACKDCFNNCNPIVSDVCVKYTGEDVELLDICNGDPISKVQEVVLDKLLSALDGSGITPKDITLENCAYLKDLLDDKDPTLANLLQLLIDSQCTLKKAVDDLTDTSIFVFDTKCLATGENPSRDEILQAAVNILCALKKTVDGFPDTYVKNSDLETQVVKIITTKSTNINQFYNRMVPFVAYEYYGTLSNFDNTGKGIVNAGFEKVYICNGQNGTPDKRGRVAVGATRNVPGGPLDAAVDPTNVANPNTNYGLGDKFGESFHKLLVQEIPSHSHGINDPGHAHDYTGYRQEGRPCGSKCDREDSPAPKTTEKATTGITIGNTGGGLSHENRQPSIAANYIMYIPS